MEAFSDGLMAVLITIMVLGLHVPTGADWAALRPFLPGFLTYVLSFVTLGIYWNNHHHLLHAADGVNGRVLWANLHLFFWLSLVPFTTGWMGENHFAPLPTAVYGAVLLMAAVAYQLLAIAIIAHQGEGSRLRTLLGGDVKGKLSLAAYAVSVPMALLLPWVSYAIFVGVALMWLVPDRRIESRLGA